MASGGKKRRHLTISDRLSVPADICWYNIGLSVIIYYTVCTGKYHESVAVLSRVLQAIRLQTSDVSLYTLYNTFIMFPDPAIKDHIGASLAINNLATHFFLHASHSTTVQCHKRDTMGVVQSCNYADVTGSALSYCNYWL